MKPDDRIIAALVEDGPSSKLLVSTMAGADSRHTKMTKLLRILSEEAEHQVSEGETIAYGDDVAVVVAPASPQAQAVLLQTASAILSHDFTPEIDLLLVEWAADLASQGLVNKEDIPSADEAILAVGSNEKIQRN